MDSAAISQRKNHKKNVNHHYIKRLLLLIAGFGIYTAPIAQDAGKDDIVNNGFDSVWYLGLAGGISNLTPEGDSAGFVPADDSGSGAKIFFGQKFKSNWSWELSYTDAGSVELTNPNPALSALIPDARLDYRISSLFINYYLNSDESRFNLYAKAGLSTISTEPSDSRIAVSSDTSTPFGLGVGAEVRFGRNWFLRLEHDSYAKDATFSSLSLGVRFGGSSRNPVRKYQHGKSLPVVIEYPLYLPEEQTTVLAEDRDTVVDVAGELSDISDELLKASAKTSAKSPANRKESEHLARQAGILAQVSERIGIVEESIKRTTNVDISTIDHNNFVNDKGEKLLLTPAEQSIELGIARRDIGKVEKAVDKYPYARQRLSRVYGRIVVVEESLLFIPPWEKEKAAMLCSDFGTIGERIHFRSESSQLTSQSSRVLDDIAKKMNRNYRVIMEVHAHTDSWGTFAFNQKLSEERANATVNYLVEQGVARARLLARGFGEWKPLDKNILQKGRAGNRRVEFVIKNPNICK
jgi:outer membrane protein OmpA-like peptidoglycan-associated protein/opacity protein-like surface antigen